MSREAPAWRARPRKVTGWPVRSISRSPASARVTVAAVRAAAAALRFSRFPGRWMVMPGWFLSSRWRERRPGCAGVSVAGACCTGACCAGACCAGAVAPGVVAWLGFQRGGDGFQRGGFAPAALQPDVVFAHRGAGAGGEGLLADLDQLQCPLMLLP